MWAVCLYSLCRKVVRAQVPEADILRGLPMHELERTCAQEFKGPLPLTDFLGSLALDDVRPACSAAPCCGLQQWSRDNGGTACGICCTLQPTWAASSTLAGSHHGIMSTFQMGTLRILVHWTWQSAAGLHAATQNLSIWACRTPQWPATGCRRAWWSSPPSTGPRAASGATFL